MTEQYRRLISEIFGGRSYVKNWREIVEHHGIAIRGASSLMEYHHALEEFFVTVTTNAQPARAYHAARVERRSRKLRMFLAKRDARYKTISSPSQAPSATEPSAKRRKNDAPSAPASDTTDVTSQFSTTSDTQTPSAKSRSGIFKQKMQAMLGFGRGTPVAPVAPPATQPKPKSKPKQEQKFQRGTSMRKTMHSIFQSGQKTKPQSQQGAGHATGVVPKVRPGTQTVTPMSVLTNPTPLNPQTPRSGQRTPTAAPQSLLDMQFPQYEMAPTRIVPAPFNPSACQCQQFRGPHLHMAITPPPARQPPPAQPQHQQQGQNRGHRSRSDFRRFGSKRRSHDSKGHDDRKRDPQQ